MATAMSVAFAFSRSILFGAWDPMDDRFIYDRLTSMFREIFGDRTIVLEARTSRADIAGWDSFSNASLIAAIEQGFAIRFRTAELQELDSVGSFVDLIAAKLRASS